MSEKFNNNSGKSVLFKIVEGIQENKDFLGEVDGKIGDGDHGMNMNKGFTLFKNTYVNSEITFADGLYELGFILINEIGGSMGPIYGTFFMKMGDKLNATGVELMDVSNFTDGMEAGLNGVKEIVEAEVGDKTFMDTLVPAINALKESVLKDNADFTKALNNMVENAKIGRDSTKNLVAKFGRSSRLGERSIGVLDAGASSFYIILERMAIGIIENIQVID